MFPWPSDGSSCSDRLFQARDHPVDGLEHLLALAGQIVDGARSLGSGACDRAVEPCALEDEVSMFEALAADVPGPAREGHEVRHGASEILVFGGKVGERRVGTGCKMPSGAAEDRACEQLVGLDPGERRGTGLW